MAEKLGPIRDRRRLPARIGHVGLDLLGTLERGDCISKTLQVWNDQVDGVMSERTKMVGLFAAPGAGKTHMLQLLAGCGVLPGRQKIDPAFAAVFDTFRDKSIYKVLSRSQGVTVTFQYGTELDPKYDLTPEQMISHRLLFSHFFSLEEDTTAQQSKFKSFRQHLTSFGLDEISYFHALNIILSDVDEETTLIVAIDEVLMAAASLAPASSETAVSAAFQEIMTSVKMIAKHPRCLVVLSTLTDHDLKLTTSAIVVSVAISVLSEAAIKTVLENYPILSVTPYRELLYESVGVCRFVAAIIDEARKCELTRSISDCRAAVLEQVGYKRDVRWPNNKNMDLAVASGFIVQSVAVTSRTKKTIYRCLSELMSDGYVYPADAGATTYVVPPMFLQVWGNGTGWIRGETAAGAGERLLYLSTRIINHSISSHHASQAKDFEDQHAVAIACQIDMFRYCDAMQFHTHEPTLAYILGCDPTTTKATLLQYVHEYATFNLVLNLRSIPIAPIDQRDMDNDFDPVCQIPMNSLFVPVSPNNPGWDSIGHFKTIAEDDVILLVEDRMREVHSVKDIADKFAKSFFVYNDANDVIACRTKFLRLFCERRLVYAIGGGVRSFSYSADKKEVIDQCASALLAKLDDNSDLSGVDRYANELAMGGEVTDTFKELVKCSVLRLSVFETMNMMSPALARVCPMSEWSARLKSASFDEEVY